MLFSGESQIEVIREIAENLSDPVFLVDKAFNVWYYNRAFQDAVGVRMASRRYKDRPCHELLGLDICSSDCAMKRAVEAGRPLRLAEISGETAGGLSKNFQINAIPLVNAEGNAFGSLNILRDNTVEVSLQEKYKEMVQRTTKISLSGRIEDKNLPDILQLFSFLQKSGRMVIQGEAISAELVLDEGKVIYATCGKVTGEKAFARVAVCVDATFEFDSNASIDVPKRITTNSDFLIMDVLREEDELKRIGKLPSRETKLSVLREADAELDMLDETALELLAFIATTTTVGELLDAAPPTDGKCYVALMTLRAREVVFW